MLLPGFACDQSQSQSPSVPLPPFARIQPAASLFASPPASPPQMSSSAMQNPINNLFTTCRSLQSLLAGSAPAPTPSSTALPISPPLAQQQLPTPPLAHAPSPMKLRLRSRKPANGPDSNGSNGSNGRPIARKRIVKRIAPRGVNKRRRAMDDDMGRDDDLDSDNGIDKEDNNDVNTETAELQSDSQYRLPAQFTSATFAPSLAPSPFGRETTTFPPAIPATPAIPAMPATTSLFTPAQPAGCQEAACSAAARPQTPKRARIAPESLPLGLERGDFHALHPDGIPDHSSSKQTDDDAQVEADGESWSTEEDRMLVELVLEKLQLSKSDWQDCARSLGKKDRHSLGRRWKSLMLHGDIGLKNSSRNRRAKIHGTWR